MRDRKPKAAPRDPYSLARALCLAAGLHPCKTVPDVICGCAEGECRMDRKNGQCRTP